MGGMRRPETVADAREDAPGDPEAVVAAVEGEVRFVVVSRLRRDGISPYERLETTVDAASAVTQVPCGVSGGRSTVRVRFVDGPLAGVVRLIEAAPDGDPPPAVSMPMTDPGLEMRSVVYERLASCSADGDARYRVAPL